MPESFVERRKRELGLVGGAPTADSGGLSFVQRRKMELGLIPDVRPEHQIDVEQSDMAQMDAARRASAPSVSTVFHPENSQLFQQIQQEAEARQSSPEIMDNANAQAIRDIALARPQTLGDKIFQDNPVARAISAPFKYLDQAAASGPYLDNKTDELGFRSLGERMAYQDPAATGNATYDKVAQTVGNLAAPFVPLAGGPVSGFSQIPIVQRLAGAAGGKLGGALGKVAESAIKGAAEGAPQNVAGELAINPNADAKDLATAGLTGAALGGGLGAVGTGIGMGLAKWAEGRSGTLSDYINRFIDRQKPVETAQPEPQPAEPPKQYKTPAGPQSADDVMKSIMEEVNQRATPPLESPKLLDKYLLQHLGEDVPKAEIDALSYADKAELAGHVRDSLNTDNLARQVAQERGYNWDHLQKPTETQTVSPEPVAPKMTATHPTQEPVKSEPVQQVQPLQPAKRTETPPKTMNERGHTFTVRTSGVTPEPLKQAYEQPETYKTRSTQKLFDDAQKFIAKNGQHEAYDFVMKAKKMTDRHNAVAQILSKQFANSGDISRAIDVVSKTAQSGTELGRAIQALSLWNRMDTEGAMLLAQRQINKNAPAGEYRTLTPDQAEPVIAATKKIQEVEQTKSLADEVLNIVSNKQPGEKLTDAEVAKIKEFQKQVTDINGKVKQFLPDKEKQAKKIIEEVNKIPPGERTTDQLRDYWDARAERARRKLAAQRHVGLLPNTENPVLLYAELGVAKIAKGALNLADFSDQMVREFGERVKPIINQVYNQSLDMFRKSQGLPTTNELNKVVRKAVEDRELDAETAAQFKNWADQIAFYTDENLRTEAVQDLQLALRQLDTGTFGQKLSSLQAGAQLLSIPTTVRNVVGNEAFNALEKVNKMSAVPIDWALSKITGERTVVFNPQNQEKYWENWFQGLKSGWKGVSPNGKLSSYDIRPEVFGDRNPLKYVTKLTGAELQSFDHAAYMRAYGDVLATYAEQLGKTQGLKGTALKEAMPSLIKQLDQSIYDIAEEAGRYATFQDDTVLSKAAEAVKKGLNYPTKLIGDAAVNAGILPEGWNPSGFGLGDIVLKYAKTPANIVMRAVDYSPIGILRGIMQIAPLLTKREFNQRQAVLALSRGITGTLGLTGLGYYLASQGILTGAQSNDWDVRELQNAAGQKGYQVNLSALQRWIMSGLDKDAAKFQNGDKLINYDWLQPMAISLAMGVNANQAVEQKKAGVTKTTAAIARDAIIGGLKTVMQQPLVQGLQKVADATSNLMKYGSWTGFANIFKGVPASFVPSVSGQVRNFTDNTARSTYDPSALKSMINMVINKIPGLAERLPPQIDSLSGQPKSVVDGGKAGTLGQGLNVFVNPAKVSEYHVSPEAAMVVQLINDTGDNRVAPRVPNRYLMIDRKKVDLTPQQYLQLQQDTSQYTAQQLQRMSPMLTNPSIAEQKKIDAVIKVLNDAGSRARKQLQNNYPELKPKKTAR